MLRTVDDAAVLPISWPDCGVSPVLSMTNNAASFVAAEDCQLIMLSRQAINHLIQENLAPFSILMMNLARELVRKLQFTDKLMLKSERKLANLG